METLTEVIEKRMSNSLVDFKKLVNPERKTILRHDGNIMEVLIACPELFERLAGFVKSVERFKRREAKKAVSQEQKNR